MSEPIRILWTKTARDDLLEIIEYIKLDSSSIALQILNKIESKVSRLADFPRQGRIVPELKNLNVYRYYEIIISPWRVIYRIEQQRVYIMAVIDGRRNVEDVLLNRQIR